MSLRLAPFAVLALAACAPSEAPVDSALDALGTGPGFLRATSDNAHGMACAFTADEWTTLARPLLLARWSALGEITLDGRRFTSAEDALDALERGSDSQRTFRALDLNRAMNSAGVFGRYADFEHAQVTRGALAGLSAGELSRGGRGRDRTEAGKHLNGGFGGCDPDDFTDTSDRDGDGVADTLDCDDNDATIGALLYNSDLSSDEGYFAPTPQMHGDWSHQDGWLGGHEGGQAVDLGQPELWTDVVVMSTVTAWGTQVGCGFDCAEVCGEYEPTDGYYRTWEAIGLGLVSAQSDDRGALVLCNDSDHDVLLDPFTTFDAATSQSVSMGASEVVLGANSCEALWYGSWTTDNGRYAPRLGDPAYWCMERGTHIAPNIDYALMNARLPDDMAELIATMDALDLDHDGRSDSVDWAGDYGVQGQQNIWDYQNTHAAVLVGKTARATTDGTLAVTLTVENRGALAAPTVQLRDVVPAAWELIDCDVAPSTSAAAAGGEQLAWTFALDGCQNDCAVVDRQIVTCELSHRMGVDVDHASLPEATAAYSDGDDSEVSRSFPALIKDYDADGDGEIRCGSTDRWRAGVLGRAALDDDQDEGFHGYRCALSRNQEEGCYNPGHFLQIGEFEDVAEDGISSECEENCPGNNSFAQHARTDHEAFDISAGDIVDLRFWLVGEDLYCEATDGEQTVSARGSDRSFTAGGTGLSSLNAWAAYDDLSVCEAFAVPAPGVAAR